jgi:MinD superfamily P-loop ATPase
MRAKEIVFISGKGGTGKTTITSSFVYWLYKNGYKFVIADADVDAADMHILLAPKVLKKESFIGKSIAEIRNDACTSCDLCRQYCRYEAIDIIDSEYIVNPFRCDGCGLCQLVCPVDAIDMIPQTVGEWYISDTNSGKMVHAKLYPGAENSGNLVTMVKHQAHLITDENNIPLIVVDGPPGIGCPVTSSLSGASYAIIASEPTLSAIHDMERAVATAKHFNVPVGIIINKATLNEKNTQSIRDYAKKRDIPVIGEIPFSRCVVDSLVDLKFTTDGCPELKEIFENMFKKILEGLK